MSRISNPVFAVCLLPLAACASTSIKTTWKAPGARPSTFAGGDKVLAMVVSSDESLRRRVEPVLAAELRKRGLEGVPADTVVPTKVIPDEARARPLVKASGAAGVVAMLVVGQEKEARGPAATYAGPHYGAFWNGFYGWGWGLAYDPTYLRTDTAVSVETLVYDLGGNELVWASRSKAMDPSNVESALGPLALKSVEEMEKEGLLR
jgi:hypothetical protein